MIKSKLTAIIFILIALSPFAQVQQKAVVDYKADVLKFKNQGEYIELIGNVVFYHNGVFITCDTAYRYSEQHMEGVGNVIINSDSTFIYGDKFIYNGETNIARVFSPLIKTIDSDAILYTHNMEFNTLSNIGKYYGGGTTNQGTNLMESERGIYFVDSREILLIGDVEMQNENYKIISDSVRYNFNSEIATFLTNTDIWNATGEYLKAERGNYDTRRQIYDFYKEAYILTEEQELWADSMVYYSVQKKADLQNNIQVFDELKRIIMLGDQGKYWGASKRVMATRNPAVVSYNAQGGDSTFLRADTLLMVPMLDPLYRPQPIFEDTTAVEMPGDFATDSISAKVLGDSIRQSTDSMRGMLDSMRVDTTMNDSLSVKVDVDTTEVVVQLSKREQEKIDKQLAKEQKAKEKQLQQEEKAAAKQLIEEQKTKERELKEEENAIKRAERIAKLLEKAEERAKRHGHDHDHDHEHDHSEVDSTELIDSTAIMLTDSLDMNEEIDGFEPLVADSSDYYIYALKNVKSYKSDTQMVCDSMIVNSLDSTSTLYIKPVVWNMSNQITADSLKLFTYNEMPYKVEMYQFPILAQQIAATKFNQVKGRYMEAYFAGTSIDILYVDGNSESIYYRIEEEGPTAVINVTAANMIMYFDSTEISKIKWLNNYELEVVPIEKINPETVELLPDFNWEEELRPLSPFDITTRKIRKSIRIAAEKIEEPSFSITETINDEKIKFTQQGIWRDRDEDIPVNKVEYINRVLE
ncbi:MAG: OstA-like protein [Rikenellaceae bacterium]